RYRASNLHQSADARVRALERQKARRIRRAFRQLLEREKGLEPSTSTLARWHSTTELLPQVLRFRDVPRKPAKTIRHPQACQARALLLSRVVLDHQVAVELERHVVRRWRGRDASAPTVGIALEPARQTQLGFADADRTFAAQPNHVSAGDFERG